MIRDIHKSATDYLLASDDTEICIIINAGMGAVFKKVLFLYWQAAGDKFKFWLPNWFPYSEEFAIPRFYFQEITQKKGNFRFSLKRARMHLQQLPTGNFSKTTMRYGIFLFV